MRAAPPPACSPLTTSSRTNRPVVLTGCVVTLAVFPVTCTTGLKFVPSDETRMSKSRVLNEVLSPPAPACRTVQLVSDMTEPRSTVSAFVPATSEHHLSLVPPDTLPLTAFSGPSLALHGVEPVAGLFSATFVVGGRVGG